MEKNKKSIIVLAFGIITLVGCGTDSPNEPPFPPNDGRYYVTLIKKRIEKFGKQPWQANKKQFNTIFWDIKSYKKSQLFHDTNEEINTHRQDILIRQLHNTYITTLNDTTRKFFASTNLKENTLLYTELQNYMNDTLYKIQVHEMYQAISEYKQLMVLGKKCRHYVRNEKFKKNRTQRFTDSLESYKTNPTLFQSNEVQKQLTYWLDQLSEHERIGRNACSAIARGRVKVNDCRSIYKHFSYYVKLCQQWHRDRRSVSCD